MRLLDVKSYPPEVVEFPGFPNIPPYVILSHTWGPGEVTLQDLQLDIWELEDKEGFGKLVGFCRKARSDGFDYGWMDGYMLWYSNAKICYAYLSDVPIKWSVISPFEEHFDRHDVFRKSKWFSRGWTLQELIAPEVVEFYTQDWSPIGTKASLKFEISSITQIDVDILGQEKLLQDCNVAERMSWGASRTTTRLEDMAYCLLGLFDVNMPLIYGEGKKAFLRLQEEILRRNEDYTILAWGMWDPEARQQLDSLATSMVLADTISRFRVPQHSRMKSYSQLVQQDLLLFQSQVSHPPTMTSRGLSVALPILEIESHSSTYLAYIGCHFDGKAVCIPLQCVKRGDDSTPSMMFRRLSAGVDGLEIDGLFYASMQDEREPYVPRGFETASIYIIHENSHVISTQSICMNDLNLYELNLHRPLAGLSAWDQYVCEWLRLWLDDKRDTDKFVPPTMPFCWDKTYDFNFLPCITDGKEMFVIVLGRHGPDIIEIAASDQQPRDASVHEILSDAGWDVLNFQPGGQQEHELRFRYRKQDQITRYFKNCAVHVSYKLFNGDVLIHMSSWSTSSAYELKTSTEIVKRD